MARAVCEDHHVARSGSGLAFGVAAYLCWGLFPLYWPLLEPAGPLEVLASRFVWSLVFVAVALTLLRHWREFGRIFTSARLMGLLTVAATTIATNWGVYIYGVTHGHVVETSLGYFINPLVTVLLGVFVLGEKLRPAQWVALVVGAIAVVILAVNYGRPPWIALVLAFSFGCYGFVKKTANVGTFNSLGMETLIGSPVALGFMIWLQINGTATFGHEGPTHTVLMMGAGVVTAIPLLLFGAAAIRLSLTHLGLLQYLNPALQFLLGLIVFGEQMSGVRWAGFVLVWLALSIFTIDAVHARRRVLRESAENVAL